MTDKDITICGHGSGNPSTKNLNVYSESRYSSTFSYDGKTYRKGIIRVRRLKDLTDAQRVKFHDTYKTILGRNIYNPDLRQYVYDPHNGKYYSDCSSSGMATLKKIGHTNLGLLNTVGILESSVFEDVPVVISKGHITNPEVLKVGDAILFAGNKNRPKVEFCGHVEWVYVVPDGTTPTKTTTETAVSTCTVTPRVLRKGCKGNDVKIVQRTLIFDGYDLGKYGADGEWGNLTDTAFIAWQNKHSANVGKPDGICGKMCWAYILRE